MWCVAWMRRDVVPSGEAERDLKALVRYLSSTEAPANRQRVLDRGL